MQILCHITTIINMFKIRIRVIVGIMIFFGYFLIYIVRYSISAHIIDMAHVMSRKDHLSREIHDAKDFARNSMMFGRVMGHYWDDMAVGSLFAAYHVGYCIIFPIFYILGGSLGPTYVIGITGLTSGVMCCVTPASVFLDYWAIFVVRIIMGLCAGAMQPSMVLLLRYWVPPIERNHFVWSYCGITTGTLCTFLLCAGVHYYWRWTVGFYGCGVFQILWAAIWMVVVADTPKDHSYISKEELTYLENTITSMFTIKMSEHHTPWDLIIRSKPFWALCILNFGYSWLIIALCIYGPFYYTVVAGYTVYTASALTALPFLFRLVLGYLTIHTFYWYKYHSKVRKIENLRKYFIVVSHVIPGVLIAITWFTHLIPGPVLLSIAVALTAAGMDLTLDLCYELTPTYVNSVTTAIKIIGNTAGIIIPLCVGVITKRYKNWPIVWKHLWCFHATILFLSGVIFLVWGETKVQPWNSVTRRIYKPAPRKILPSVMSDIIEVDEEAASNRTSLGPTANTSQTKKSKIENFKRFMNSKL